MATVTCPTCHTRFGVGNRGTARCPECGEPLDVERKKIPVPGWVWLLVGLGAVGALLFLMANLLPQRSKSAQLDQIEHPISALDLATAYRGNEMAADKTYRGKHVLVVGAVDRVGMGPLGKPYIVLKTAAGLPDITCSFDTKEASSLTSIRPNDPISICGLCVGQSLGDVMVGNCWVVP